MPKKLEKWPKNVWTCLWHIRDKEFGCLWTTGRVCIFGDFFGNPAKCVILGMRLFPSPESLGLPLCHVGPPRQGQRNPQPAFCFPGAMLWYAHLQELSIGGGIRLSDVLSGATCGFWTISPFLFLIFNNHAT